jgi:hypothetical protein
VDVNWIVEKVDPGMNGLSDGPGLSCVLSCLQFQPEELKEEPEEPEESEPSRDPDSLTDQKQADSVVDS